MRLSWRIRIEEIKNLLQHHPTQKMPAGSEHVLDLDISVVTKVATGNSKPEIATSAGSEPGMNPKNSVMSKKYQGGPSHLTVRRIPKNSTGSTKYEGGEGKSRDPKLFHPFH